MATATNSDLPLMMTAEEVAAELRVSRRTVDRMNSAGEIPKPVYVRGDPRWRRSEFTAWVDKGCPKVT